MNTTLQLTQEWDKVFPLSDKVTHEKVTFKNRFVIDRSKQLLVETRLPVSEIAYQLGFEYPQHFTRLFKSRTGKTPNEYRLTA